jgi:hypothetical protein
VPSSAIIFTISAIRTAIAASWEFPAQLKCSDGLKKRRKVDGQGWRLIFALEYRPWEIGNGNR